MVLFRILTSVHEAVNIQNILGCREKGRDLTPLWLLYIMALVQYLQVRLNKKNCRVQEGGGGGGREQVPLKLSREGV